MFNPDVDFSLHKNFFPNLSHQWEMSIAERIIFIWLLQFLRPKISLEIGSRNGGSLIPLSRLSEKVYVVDIDSSIPERLKSIGKNINFNIGDSAFILADLLSRLKEERSLPSFIHIDGDHSKKGAAHDLDTVLQIVPSEKTYILMHDTFNFEVRNGIFSLNFNDYKHLHLVDIDFMTGILHTRESVINEMWGGFSLFILEPNPRTDPLKYSNYLEKQYRISRIESLRTPEEKFQHFFVAPAFSKINNNSKSGLYSDNYYLNNYGEIEEIPENNKWQKQWPICTVVIPCFNYGKFLEEAINSAINQTLNSIEIIVVDDGSTDIATLAVLQKLMLERKVKVILKQNQGLSEARNSGIRAALGKYICCLDADDIIHPSYLEHCIYYLESDGMLGIVGSWVKLFGDENYVWKTRSFNILDSMDENHTSVASVFRRSDWNVVGGYDSRMDLGYEDWEFWLRIGQLGRNGFVIQAPLYFHRRHGLTMTHTANDKREYLIEKIKNLNQKLFNDKAWQNKLSECAELRDSREPSQLKEAQKSLKGESILIILPWLKPGGAEELMLDITSRLSQKYNITIVTTVDDIHQKLPDFLNLTKDIFHFYEQTSINDFSNFINYLVETRNIVHSLISGSELGYRVLPLLENLKVVDILHNNSDLGHMQSSIKYNKFLNGTICVSDVILKDLVNSGISKNKLVTILNGVDGTTLFKPHTDKYEKNRNPINPITIGYVGRASEEKRPLLFLELCKRLNKSCNISILMVSDGPMIKVVEETIILLGLNNLEIIRNVNRNDMPEIYRRIDILVNVSSVEGMPISVVEALACGCPVAAMDVGNLSELIKDGVNGILVPKNDISLLQTKLEDFISSDLINNFNLRARNSYLSMKLDITTMLDKYESNLFRLWHERYD